MASSADEELRKTRREKHFRNIAERLRSLIAESDGSEKRIRSQLTKWDYRDLVDVKKLEDFYLSYPTHSPSQKHLLLCKLIASELVTLSSNSATSTDRATELRTNTSDCSEVPRRSYAWQSKLKEVFRKSIKLRPALEKHLKRWNNSELGALVSCSPAIANGKHERRILHLCKIIASSFLAARESNRKRQRYSKLEKNSAGRFPSVPKFDTNIPRSNCQKCRTYLKVECWAASNINTDRVPSNAHKLCNDCYALLSAPQKLGYKRFKYRNNSVWPRGTGHGKKK